MRITHTLRREVLRDHRNKSGPGKARPGAAGRGRAWLGKGANGARRINDTEWLGMTRCGAAWRG